MNNLLRNHCQTPHDCPRVVIIDNNIHDGHTSSVKAVQLVRERISYTAESFAEVVVWRLQSPLPGSKHLYKYRLAFVVLGECVLRYDNEAGKGDHRHLQGKERDYAFTSTEQLLADFTTDVQRLRNEDSAT